MPITSKLSRQRRVGGRGCGLGKIRHERPNRLFGGLTVFFGIHDGGKGRRPFRWNIIRAKGSLQPTLCLWKGHVPGGGKCENNVPSGFHRGNDGCSRDWFCRGLLHGDIIVAVNVGVRRIWVNENVVPVFRIFRTNSRVVPAVGDRCLGHLAPCSAQEFHCTEDIDFEGAGLIVGIQIEGADSESTAVMRLEAPDDTGVTWLDV
ncbi:hypothetical protein B0H16DRAFT_1603364 [Mycena metata]|uniref:Uncharacterized protein n=1 Tax=Mycena metata TaxID=1033252 RepID=A0AAD7HHW5_9AGAR|nr:hypothetical protein B0H16DRAFT_1603364 [Mycena metata]